MEPKTPPNQNPPPKPEIEHVGSDRIAVLMELDDGCHLVLLNDAQRAEVARLILRMHSNEVKVADTVLPLHLVKKP